MTAGFLSRRQSLRMLAAAPALLPAAAAAESAEGNGLVVLTVGGLVGAPNRGPSSETSDPVLVHGNYSFNKARRFSLAELCALPQRALHAHAYRGEGSYKGPLLSAVIGAAQPLPEAKTARLFALDGYGAELALADVQPQDWVLAMEADGQAFGIGDFGPLYAMRPLPGGQKPSEEESAKWIFGLYYIELAA